jgi:hypothetical protein
MNGLNVLLGKEECAATLITAKKLRLKPIKKNSEGKLVIVISIDIIGNVSGTGGNLYTGAGDTNGGWIL